MAGYSGAYLLRQTFVHESRERVRQGGTSVDSFVARQRFVGVLADADARMVQLAAARSLQVSHQLMIEAEPVAKSGDRFVLRGGPITRYFYVQTYEEAGPSRFTVYATFERNP